MDITFENETEKSIIKEFINEVKLDIEDGMSLQDILNIWKLGKATWLQAQTIITEQFMEWVYDERRLFEEEKEEMCELCGNNHELQETSE
jgi:hypothetical protein